MVKKNKKNDGLDDILSNVSTYKQAEKIINSLTRDERRELKALLNSSGRNFIGNKLSSSDIKKLLKLLTDKEESIGLYGTNELRPPIWSKTVTIFDVYETDEEGFVPYISPLATVGTINSSSSSGSDIGTDGETTDDAGQEESSQEEGPSIWNTLSFGLLDQK